MPFSSYSPCFAVGCVVAFERLFSPSDLWVGVGKLVELDPFGVGLGLRGRDHSLFFGCGFR